jgi:hypothetical protein
MLATGERTRMSDSAGSLEAGLSRFSPGRPAYTGLNKIKRNPSWAVVSPLASHSSYCGEKGEALWVRASGENELSVSRSLEVSILYTSMTSAYHTV